MTDPYDRVDPFTLWLDYAVDAADDHAEGIGSGPRRPREVTFPPAPDRWDYRSEQAHRDAVKRWEYVCDRMRAGEVVQTRGPYRARKI